MNTPCIPAHRRSLTFAACLVASLAASQAGIAETAPTGSTTIAHVYVSYTPSGSSTNKVAGFRAGADGVLTTISGSPFLANVGSMAVTGGYFFGSNMNGNSIASFRIKPNGVLHWLSSTNVQTPDPTGCVYPSDIILDHSGATLYRVQYSGGLCDHTHYQSFWINKANGMLHFLGKSGDIFLFNAPLSFIGNNKYAYGSGCLNYQGFPLANFNGYMRQSSGLLDLASISAPDPATQNMNDFYCRAWTAADPTNHLAVTFTDTDFNNPYSSPPTQLGVYTSDAAGNLTTSSTWSNMPSTGVGSTTGLAMSRDGRVLAAMGSSGLQVFHFNGAGPITPYTGLLTTDSIDLAFWDHNDHLYALSKSAGRLYVFTVTATSFSPAPGSPHAIPSPASLIVQPLTDSDGDRDHD